ncbi:MAG: deoxyribonuclease V [Synechococcales cyanobacterium RM1_1_8]|nr:deoxyribonuclease V [Synechococcales cyanobacterium RM1_1_8]
MNISQPDWPKDTQAAIALQRQLATQIITTDDLGDIQYVAGVDVGFEEGGTVTRAAVVVLTFPELELVETAIARTPTTFPYIPGLLSFREAPALLEALAQLKTEPDLILCDGQGIAHPRRLGIASHLGLLLDKPTIGVAKSRYIGTYAEPAAEKGNWTELMDKGDRIGAVLRTRTHIKPLFISIGHRVSLERAIAILLSCTTKYKLPEPTRLADRLASRRGPMPALK